MASDRVRFVLHVSARASPLLCMTNNKRDPNERDMPAPAGDGNRGWRAVIVVLDAVFAGLASLYMATRSVDVVLVGAGLAILFVMAVVASRRR